MRTARNGDELIGMTIAALAEIDDHLVLRFTDGTYAGFHLVTSDGECAAQIDALDENPTQERIAREYLEFGLYTSEEFAAWQQRRDATLVCYETRRNLEERATYERLKAKFGGDER